MSNVFDKNNYYINWHTVIHCNHIRCLARDLKYSWQRITKGYCDTDVYWMTEWFLEIVPCMIQELKVKRISSPDASTTDDGKDFQQQWSDRLDEMIFAFREARPETCLRKNRYEDEWRAARKEFVSKYGWLGEGLLTDEEKEEGERTGRIRKHLMRELPEYKEIDEKHTKEMLEIMDYQDEQLKKALKLFVENIRDLWS